MASGNFERCLSVTLRWEGNYSNHPDAPGGPTMRGITQREYDGWRKQNRRSKRSVKQIGEQELHDIYRGGYWDRLGCDGLPAGLDLCVFDAGVNSGVARAEAWLVEAGEIDSFCDRRLAFLKQTGRLWRVFGQGWRRRVAGIRVDAHAMAGDEVPALKEDNTLHAGMRGGQVRHLQKRLRRLGYPCGLEHDGIRRNREGWDSQISFNLIQD